MSLFKVIDDLSKWSPYCEEKTYDFWSQKFPITSEQSSVLAKYAEIRKNYDWGDFEPCFLKSTILKQSISCLSQKLETHEIKTVKSALYTFKKDFDSLWDSDNYLQKRKKQIEEEMNKINVNELLSIIATLYSLDTVPSSIDIYLLFNPTPNNSDGGANGGVFIRNGKNVPIEDDLMVLFHEFTHTVSDSLNALLFKLAQQKGIPDNFDLHVLHEAIDYTLFPGYFYEEYLRKPFDLKEEAIKQKDKSEYLYLIYSLAGEVYPDVKKLIHDQENFDQQFISEMIEFYVSNFKSKADLQN
ncbi:MAG: hypothetical protein GWN01_10125 [Nitrosopumilaceae archaeon]|nr:hypothetical protein [Nitrosopumilaceae archaeon]NIU87608.1 hypothetical protein [Nitrosopumilaceae archaeon]NIV66040.1 hypothetical protein [Nitrosopumilaceae archaeon]NIX61860.1 hypothetical protein [Nitrosopumilaceae archaeon]